MPQAKLRAIIFDIGRVLIRVDVSRAMSSLAQPGSVPPQDIWSAIQNDPRWSDWQEGRMSARDWHLNLNKRLGGTLSFHDFSTAWNQALDPQPIQHHSLFEKLSKRYRLALLSNTDPIHVAHMESTYDFFRFFPHRIYSCTLGASKPSPLIFREALRACHVPAQEALFIDDVPDYVEAARSLGMSGIVYQSPQQLAESLASFGVDA